MNEQIIRYRDISNFIAIDGRNIKFNTENEDLIENLKSLIEQNTFLNDIIIETRPFNYTRNTSLRHYRNSV
jgi:hypothetical protein